MLNQVLNQKAGLDNNQLLIPVNFGIFSPNTSNPFQDHGSNEILESR